MRTQRYAWRGGREATMSNGDNVPRLEPGEATDCRFVADVNPDELDFPHQVLDFANVVSVSIATTRYVGAVDSEGTLLHVAAHTERGTLAPLLLLTIRAEIAAPDWAGKIGSKDGLNVVAYLHRDTDREVLLGPLIGTFGMGWDTYRFH